MGRGVRGRIEYFDFVLKNWLSLLLVYVIYFYSYVKLCLFWCLDN